MKNRVQQFRLNRLFDMYDANRDGYLTLEDFTDHARKLAAQRGWPADSGAARRLLDALTGWWQQILTADADHDGRVDRAELIAWAEGLQTQLQKSVDEKAPWPLKPWIDALFGVIDKNRDGRISVEEYGDWLRATGVGADTDVEAAFLGFDKNNDGELSREEFAEVSRRWWLEFDSTIGAHRWIGP